MEARREECSVEVPCESSALVASNAVNPYNDIPELARRYAAGDLTWPQIRERHDLHFGDLLAELKRQGLQLPREVDPERVARLAALLERFRPDRHGGEIPPLNT